MIIETLKKDLTDDEKSIPRFGEIRAAELGMMGIEGIEKLPAIRWKLANERKEACRASGQAQRTFGL